MDKLVEHGIRMLEIVEGENDFFRNDAKCQADIARAVYDTILRVQVLERKADRKTENSSEKPNTCKPQSLLDAYIKMMDEEKTEPQTQLTAKRLECNNSKACKENHWEDCRYEPLGYEVTAVVGTIKDEPQTERPCGNCQEFDCYGCDYKQTEREGE